MLTIPRYSRVGERCADGETKTLELNTPKNSPLEDRVHGAIPNLFILVKEASKHKKKPFYRKLLERNLEQNSHSYRYLQDKNLY